MDLSSDFDYNSQRENLILKEYGRNIQKITRYITTLPTQEERTRMAHTLIQLMKQVNPSVKENHDNPQRIWDHMHLMADFDLDIDSPYPQPDEEVLNKKPERVDYNQNQIRFKHYGKNIERLVAKAQDIVAPEERKAAFIQVAKLMKNFFQSWNKEASDSHAVIEHLEIISGEKMTWMLEALEGDERLLHSNQGGGNGGHGHHQKRGNSHHSNQSHGSNNGGGHKKKRNKRRY